MVCLVKPQFETEKEKVGKKGVVRDPQVHKEVLISVLGAMGEIGFQLIDLDFSPIRGPEGNIEYLAYIRKESKEPTPSDSSLSSEWMDKINDIVARSHEQLS